MASRQFGDMFKNSGLIEINLESEAEKRRKEARLAAEGPASEFEKLMETWHRRTCDNKPGWQRVAPPDIDTQRDPMVFHAIDVQTYQATNVRHLSTKLRVELTVARLFGVTMEGQSVCCNIMAHKAALILTAPGGFTEENCQHMLGFLNRLMVFRIRKKNRECRHAVLDVELMEETSSGMRLLRITVCTNEMVAEAEAILVKERLYTPYNRHRFVALQNGVDSELRLIAESNLFVPWANQGDRWLLIKEKAYTLVRTGPASRCQIEIIVQLDDLEEDRTRLTTRAPLRILSFDIECCAKPGVFPRAEVNNVVQISSMVMTALPEPEHIPLIRAIFTLNTCDPIMGSEVHSYQTEKELLEKWSEFVRAVDPDIITGYNAIEFDLKYLLERAKKIGAEEFPKLGRLSNICAKVGQKSFPNEDRRDKTEIKIEGRVILDIYQIIRAEYKLPKYSLDAVSERFLNESKEKGVDPNEICYFQYGSSMTRRRMAVYCLKDSYLPLLLMFKLEILDKKMRLAHENGVPLSLQMTRSPLINRIRQLRMQ